jgi:nitrogen fixation protein FixH
MTSRAETHESRGISGRHVLAAMLAFFGVIIVADATMIYKAVSTFGGVDNANAYRDGLAYNARIESEMRQTALGWHEAVEFLSDPARLRVSLRDKGGRPPANVRIEATLGRPATITSDTQVHLAEVSPGVFEAAVGERIEPGTWIATARVLRQDTNDPFYQIRRRLWFAP